MTTLPPHPGLSGLAAREATTPADVTRAADDDADHEGLTHAEWAAVNARLRTRAALGWSAALARHYRLYDDPVPCGCCGPQLCCCPCHKEER